MNNDKYSQDELLELLAKHEQQQEIKPTRRMSEVEWDEIIEYLITPMLNAITTSALFCLLSGFRFYPIVFAIRLFYVLAKNNKA